MRRRLFDGARTAGSRRPLSLPPSAILGQAGSGWRSCLTSVCTGVGAVVLTRLLEAVQRWVWPGPTDILSAAPAG